MKYEGSNSYKAKDMANVKVFVDKETDRQTDVQTNRQAKNYIPPPPRYIGGGGIKRENAGYQTY